MIGRWKFLVLAFAAAAAMAQAPAPPAALEAPAFSQAELDQMLAPIALYPDALLSQIFMAATYPLEIVQAARWSRAYPGLRGEAAVNAAAAQPWDPSVKSLLAFPQILSMMDEKLDWTQRLGNAFLAQEQQLMATVQELRRRAYAAGNLRSNEYVRVEDQAGTLVVVPAYPQVVYLPYYSPLVVYGTWWWPAYPPVYWPPWPGYVVVPAAPVVYASAVSVAFSVGFFFGAFDWPHRHVVVVHTPPRVLHAPGHPLPPPGVWRHDPIHRRGVPYRTERVRQEFGRPIAPPTAAPRREYRGRELPAPRAGGPTVRPQAPAPTRTPPAPSVRTPPAPSVRTPPAPSARTQPSPRPQPRAVAPVREPAPRAFEGIQAGGDRTRAYSARGQASLSQRAAPQTRAVPQSRSVPQSRPAPQSRGATPGAAKGGHR